MNKNSNSLLPYKLIIGLCSIIIIGSIGQIVKANEINISDELVDIMNRVLVVLDEKEAIVEEEAELGGIYHVMKEYYTDGLCFDAGGQRCISEQNSVLKYTNDGGTTYALLNTSQSDTGGFNTDGNNLYIFPATNAAGVPYYAIIGSNATTSISDGTEVFAVVGNSSFTGNIIADGGNFVGNDAGAALDLSWEGDTDTALFVVDGSGDKVGISIATPTYTLDVGGDIGMDDKLYHNDDVDSYLSWDAADNFTLQVGGVEFIDITESTSDTFEMGDASTNFDLSDIVYIDGTTNAVGIGTTTCAGEGLCVVEAGTPLKIGYDEAYYCTFAMSSSGDLTQDCIGNDVSFAADNLVTTGNIGGANITGSGALTVDTDTIYTDVTNNAVGIGTTTPNATGASFAVNDELEVYDDTDPWDTLVELKDSAIDTDSGIINVYENDSITALISGATGEDTYFDTNLFFLDGSENKIYLATSTLGSAEDSVLTVMEGISIFDATANYDPLFHFVDSGDDALMKMYENAAQTVQIAAAAATVSYLPNTTIGLSTTTPSTTYAVDIDGDVRIGESAASYALLVDAGNGYVSIGTSTLDIGLTVEGDLAIKENGASGDALTVNGGTMAIAMGGALAVTGTLDVTGDATLVNASSTLLSVSGPSWLAGEVTMLEGTTAITATTTLTAEAHGGHTIYLDVVGQTVITLPAATDGLFLNFVINGAFEDNIIIDSAEGDNIEGALIVAGAVVDCDAEDQINFIGDGENLGDYVELRSDGSNWYIGDSGGLTSAKITCTDPS